MRNITFSADDQLIAQGRALAQARGLTLNDEFREWLKSYVNSQGADMKKTQMLNLLDDLTALRPGKQQVPTDWTYMSQLKKADFFAREQFNEREQRMLDRLDRLDGIGNAKAAS